MSAADHGLMRLGGSLYKEGLTVCRRFGLCPWTKMTERLSVSGDKGCIVCLPAVITHAARENK